MRRSIKLAAVGVLGALVTTTAFAATERADADREPNNGVVAKAGDVEVRTGEGGVVARAGDVEARAGGEQATPERRDGGATEGRDGEGTAMESGQVLMRIKGDEGVGFSGTCSVGGEEREIEGQVPAEFVFEPNGDELECEIRKTGGEGTLEIVLLSENSRSVQALSGGTAKFSLSTNGGVSYSSSSSSSRSSVSSSQSSSVVQSSSSSTAD